MSKPLSSDRCPRCRRTTEDIWTLSCFHACCEFCVTDKEAINNICDDCYEEECGRGGEG